MVSSNVRPQDETVSTKLLWNASTSVSARNSALARIPTPAIRIEDIYYFEEGIWPRTVQWRSKFMRYGAYKVGFLAIRGDGSKTRDLCHDTVPKGHKETKLRLPIENLSTRRCPGKASREPTRRSIIFLRLVIEQKI